MGPLMVDGCEAIYQESVKDPEDTWEFMGIGLRKNVEWRAEWGLTHKAHSEREKRLANCGFLPKVEHFSRHMVPVHKNQSVDTYVVPKDADGNYKDQYGVWHPHFRGFLAQDYFVTSRNIWDWSYDVPQFTVGRVGFDNWFVDWAYHAARKKPGETKGYRP